MGDGIPASHYGSAVSPTKVGEGHRLCPVIGTTTRWEVAEVPSNERGEPPILPQLRYANPSQAIDWLCRVFGFVEESRMTATDGALLVAALRSSQGGRIMVGGMTSPGYVSEVQSAVPDFSQPATPPWPNLSYSVTVMVDDVDAHHKQAVEEGALIFRGLCDQPWGWRDYEPIDLEGRFWNFSQILPS